MAPRRPPPSKAAPNATLYRIITLVVLLAGAVGVRMLMGAGLASFGLGGRSGAGSAAVEEPAAPVKTAAQAANPAEFVDLTLQENRVVIFSKSYCGFSKKGKSVMWRHLGEGAVKVVELDQREDGPALQDALAALTGARTVPRIFVDGAFIGGADDVSAKDASGDLAALLRSKGLIA